MNSKMMRFSAVAALALIGGAFANQAQAAGDATAGAADFKKICMMCHTNEAGKNKIGPSLFGVVGRKAGTATGYTYSAAMKSFGQTWDDALLDKYLADPKAVVPGNKMTYAGVKSDKDRADIIAYLDTLK